MRNTSCVTQSPHLESGPGMYHHGLGAWKQHCPPVMIFMMFDCPEVYTDHERLA